MNPVTKTETLRPTIKRRRQTVVIEHHEVAGGPEWWVLHHTGEIEVLDTASAALKAVRARAGRGNPGLTITTIEWRDTPEGFKPPTL